MSIRRYLPKSIEELIVWYERRVAPFALLAGFLLDNVFFRSVNLWTATVAFAFYLLLALTGIFLLNFVETGRITRPFLLKTAQFFPVVVQFAFGAIFSGLFVLYSQSATLAVSWLSVIILAVLLVGNERFRRRYRRFPFQVAILFIALLGFLIFFVPLIVKRIGPEIFILSCIVSVALIGLYMRAMWRVMPELVTSNLTSTARVIAGIVLVFNVLYFTNAIPPLPLALKEAGVYHHIERVGTEYRTLYEPLPWYRRYLPIRTQFHRESGEPIYAFSAVFAPSGLSANIYHEWQHYDEVTEKWTTISKVRFSIVGGRDGGYRGFSLSSSPLTGKWRVNVLTQYGQVIGRISFSVTAASGPVELEEKVF